MRIIKNKTIPNGKYEGFEKLENSTEDQIVLKKDNTTITLTKKSNGNYSEKIETKLGSQKDWKDFWKY